MLHYGRIVCLVGFVYISALNSQVFAAGGPSLGEEKLQSAGFLDRIPSPKPAGNAGPLTPEQVRAVYEADRQVDAARAAIKSKNTLRGLEHIAQARTLYENAGQLTDERRFVVLSTQGGLEYQNNQAEAALKTLSQTAAVAKKAFAGDPVYLAWVDSLLALVEYELNHDDACIVYGEEALDIFAKTSPDSVEHVCGVRAVLVRAYFRKERYAEAVAQQRLLCDLLVTSKQHETSEYAGHLFVLAKLEIMRKDATAARTVLDEAVPLLERTLGLDDAATKEARDLLAQAVKHASMVNDVRNVEREFESLNQQLAEAEAEGAMEKTLPLRERQLELVRKHFSSEDVELFQALGNLANCRARLGDYLVGAKLFREYLRLAPHCAEVKSADIGNVHYHLGLYEFQLDMKESARGHFEQALKLLPTQNREYDVRRRLSHEGLFGIDANEGNYAGVVEHAAASIAILANSTDSESLDKIDHLRCAVAIFCVQSPEWRDEANRQIALALKSATERHGPLHKVTQDVRAKEVFYWYNCGDPRCVDLALQYRAEIAPKTDPSLTDDWTLHAIRCARAFGRVAEARSLCLALLARGEESTENDRLNRASALFHLAGIEARAGNRQLALQYYAETVGLSVELGYSDDERTERRLKEWQAFEAGKLPGFSVAENPWQSNVSFTVKR